MFVIFPYRPTAFSQASLSAVCPSLCPPPPARKSGVFTRWRCLSVRSFSVCLSPVKFVKLFATWQHLAVSRGLSYKLQFSFPAFSVDSFSVHRINPSMGTIKPQSNGPLDSNTVIGTLVVDG